MTDAERLALRDFIVSVVRAEVIPGPPGAVGAPGPAGSQGEQGIPGVIGERGAAGDKGADGRDGRDGKDGIDGRDGKDGVNGKDGVASTDQLMAIIAAEVTKQLQPVVEKAVADAFAALPVQIHKGVWKEGTEYRPGNTVMWGGHCWHCDAPTTEKPYEGTAWTIMVRAGRKGADGKDYRPPNGQARA